MTAINPFRIPILACLLMGVIVNSCSEFNAFDQRMRQGVIEYAVTFPYMDGSQNMMSSLLPDKMHMYFKHDQYATEFATVGGLFKNRFISYQNESRLVHQLKVFKKKFESEYDQNSIQRQVYNLPQLTIVETNEVDTVAGFHCKKAIGIFDHVSLPEMTIYYTDEINIESPNWCTQFFPLEGVLLQYEMEQFGMRMRFRATSVQGLDVEDALLEPEPGYEHVSPDQLQVEIEELLNSFNM